MASENITSCLIQPPTDFDASQDPCHLAQINGFYGFGAWTACLLAIISSLYSLARHPNKTSSLTILPPILYINWAAVDLLRQRFTKQLAFGPLSAAIAVTHWGVGLVYLVFILAGQDFVALSTDKRRAIRRMAMFGSIVPLIALFASLIGLVGFSDMIFFTNLFLALVSIAFLGLFYVTAAYADRTPRQGLVLENCDALRAGHVYGILFLYFWLPMAVLDILCGQVPGAPVSCLFKPCAPQSIKDWDQALSLLCGSCMFMYEVGPDALNHAKERMNFLVDHFLPQRA